ncbi:vWA domain-containing protein [Shewanella mangrovisoli]|uniref:vWA domain-containing protein n=1 Tax=Shewanella mangrovisoli TaxID=2864211 RepID=UPI001C65F15F|nr:VWA domain-containing protein [Shewanella mangrovisoli]QYK08642.1 VWA domain-containing protein [Shewanella mangrovisoli]
MSDWHLELQMLAQFHFIRPLWLLTLIPLAIVLMLRWRRDDVQQRLVFFPNHLRSALTLNQGGWRSQLPLKILMLLLLLAVIICAGPTWEREASPFGEDDAALLVLLDSSESMKQQDVAPDRLSRAKHKILDLIAARSGGKTGLMVFAGSAHVAMPVTSDAKVLQPYLEAISPEVMPLSGKAAQTALSQLAEQLPANAGNSVLLLTDGVDQLTIDAFERYFTEQFEQPPYQLLILAIGDPDVQSQVPVDVDSLANLADSTGGSLYRLTIDDADIQALERKIERFSMLNSDSSMPWLDEGYWLLWPLALLSLLWFRRGWLVKWSLVLALTLPSIAPQQAYAEITVSKAATEIQVTQVSFAERSWQWWLDLWLTPDQQGAFWFNQGEFAKAAAVYHSVLNKGIAYYYGGEYKLAHSAFMQVQTDLGAYYAASALARQREYIAARKLLRTLAKKQDIAPELKADIEHNLKVIEGLIDEINQASASQANSMDDQETSIELPDDQPQTAEGADEQTSQDKMQSQNLTAEQMLGDPKLAEVWLKRVEANPEQFLRAKFQLQNLQPKGEQGTDNAKGGLQP